MTKMSKGAPKRAGGQGTGHLKASSVAAFSSTPKQHVDKHPPLGHPKRGGKSHVKAK